MDPKIVSTVIGYFGKCVYVALAMLAVWGIYNALLIALNLKKKSLLGPAAGQLIQQVEALLENKGKMQGQASGAEAAIALCQNPVYWHKAIAQLIAVALTNRAKGIAKIKALLVMEFHTEVVGSLETRLATIGTIVRMGPLLGLLGTVASMIAAFGLIGSSEKVDPATLAGEISLALWATGAGLIIATPMMVVGNHYHAKLRRLRDQTERQLQDFLDIYEKIDNKASGNRASRGAILSK